MCLVTLNRLTITYGLCKEAVLYRGGICAEVVFVTKWSY